MMPKFQVGQTVQWALVPTQGFGQDYRVCLCHGRERRGSGLSLPDCP